MKYKINRNVTADGKQFEAGQVVDAAEVPAGCVSSMLRVGHMSEHNEPEPQPLASPEKPEGDTAEQKRGRGRPKGSGKKSEGDAAAEPEKKEGDEPEPEKKESEVAADPIPAGI